MSEYTSKSVKHCRQPVRDYDANWNRIHQSGFSIGDVVIMMVGKLPIKKNGVNRRYEVCEVTKSGLVFGTEITGKNSRGKPRVLNFDSDIMFDPELAGYILTGNEEHYDPSVDIAAKKKERDRLIRMNKKICLRGPDNKDEIEKRVRDLKIGEKLWMGNYSTDLLEYTVTAPWTNVDIPDTVPPSAPTNSWYTNSTPQHRANSIMLLCDSYNSVNPYAFDMKSFSHKKFISFNKPHVLPGEE